MLMNAKAVLHTLSMSPSGIHSSSPLPPVGVSDDAAWKSEPSESTSSSDVAGGEREVGVLIIVLAPHRSVGAHMVSRGRSREGGAISRWLVKVGQSSGVGGDPETWISRSSGQETGVGVITGGRTELGERMNGQKAEDDEEEMEMRGWMIVG